MGNMFGLVNLNAVSYLISLVLMFNVSPKLVNLIIIIDAQLYIVITKFHMNEMNE